MTRQEEQFRLALELTQTGVWDWDIITGNTDWNDSHYTVLGYQPREVESTYQAWRDRVHPDDLAATEQKLLQAQANNCDYEAEYRIIYPDGTIHWVLGKGRSLYNAAGQAIRMVGTVVDITQRKQSEITLREEQEKLSLFIKYAPVSVAMFDRQMHYLSVSQRWLEVYHLASEEAIIGHSHYEIFPNIPDAWKQVHQRCLAGATEKCDEDSFTLPNGSVQCLKWEVLPWRLNTGEIGGILIFAEDITERKQIEIALQNQLTRERLVTNIAQNIRETLELDQVLQRTVDQVRKLLQADRAIIFHFQPDWTGTVITESVGNDYLSILNSNIYDPCFAQSYIEPYRQGFVTTRTDFYADDIDPCYFDLMKPFQVRANLAVPILLGQELWGLLIIHQCSAPRQWQETEIQLTKQLTVQVGIAIKQAELYEQTRQELLKRQQAEQKIIEQAALIDIATDAIFVHDLDDTILFWSKGAERLYGWTEAEVLGQKSQSLFNQDPKQAKILGQAQQKAIAEGSWTSELEQITKEGKKIIVVSRKTRIEEQFEQSHAVLVVNSNITQKKQLEKQFYHAQRLEGLGTLASGIAHDFNNILTPILGASQLLTLRLVEPDESIERLLSLLTNSARRGADLVKQILLFGRNTEGQVIVLQLGYVLKELIAVAQQTFPKSITILSEISTERLWKISADSIQMHQVFLNLMVNARDSMPNGGTLTICAENLQLTNQTSVLEKAGDYVRVTVTDTGQGIPPEFLEQIFDPFFTTKEVGKGTGLGLSTVIGIIKDHGGFIKVDSELGKGTTFHVFLPTIAGEADLATQKEKKRKERAALPKGQGELVLIVDDEAFIREVAKTALQNYNYQTMLAGDGLEAIALYQEHQQKINVVLMDMMMPNLDGAATIKRLQTINPEVKVIVTTGLLDHQTKALLSDDIKICLPKPYTLKQILIALREIIGS